MVEWHHLFTRHECGQNLGDDEGQGGLAQRVRQNLVTEQTMAVCA